jgi:hypothetical protein
MASKDPTETERLAQLTLLTDRLAEIISEEISILQDRRPREIAVFEEEKTRLAKIYAAEITRLRREPDVVKGVPRDVTDSLKHATSRFHEIVVRQETMLNAMKTVSERMIRDIATELNRMRAPANTYGRNAAYAGARAQPFALNRSA